MIIFFRCFIYHGHASIQTCHCCKTQFNTYRDHGPPKPSDMIVPTLLSPQNQRPVVLPLQGTHPNVQQQSLALLPRICKQLANSFPSATPPHLAMTVPTLLFNNTPLPKLPVPVQVLEAAHPHIGPLHQQHPRQSPPYHVRRWWNICWNICWNRCWMPPPSLVGPWRCAGAHGLDLVKHLPQDVHTRNICFKKIKETAFSSEIIFGT